MSTENYNNPTFALRKQRADIVVCELKLLFPVAKTILEFSNNWELTVAVMLSAQTTDKQVNVVTRTLFKKYPKLSDYVAANPAEFERDVSSVNYYKTKSKHILKSAHKLHTEFNGILPRTAREMQTLPGVGRKTALVVLGNAYNIVEGIAVDTHVRRLSMQFGLTSHTDPQKIEADLVLLIPRDEWFHFTNRMIDYGRTYAPAHSAAADDPISKKLAILGKKM